MIRLTSVFSLPSARIAKCRRSSLAWPPCPAAPTLSPRPFIPSSARWIGFTSISMDTMRFPAAAKDDPRVVPIFSRDVPGLHGDGKFLGLTMETNRCLYLGVDDDIAYPRDYVRKMRKSSRSLPRFRGRRISRIDFTRSLHKLCEKPAKPSGSPAPLSKARYVDVLGTGTVMFDTEMLRFDVRTCSHVNMLDLYFALEAATADLH